MLQCQALQPYPHNRFHFLYDPQFCSIFHQLLDVFPVVFHIAANRLVECLFVHLAHVAQTIAYRTLFVINVYWMTIYIPCYSAKIQKGRFHVIRFDQRILYSESALVTVFTDSKVPNEGYSVAVPVIKQRSVHTHDGVWKQV